MKRGLNPIRTARSRAMERLEKMDLKRISVPKPKVLSEFRDFLREYNVMALAIAFVIGTASTALVKSLVDNIIMPLITPFIPGGDWQSAKLALGPFVIGWGPFLSALINFMIIAFAVFLIAKWVLKEEKVTKK